MTEVKETGQIQIVVSKGIPFQKFFVEWVGEIWSNFHELVKYDGNELHRVGAYKTIMAMFLK